MMKDNRPEVKAAWIVGILALIGVVLTIIFNSPSVQQNMTGPGTQIGTNTGTINIGSPEPETKDADQ